MRHFQFLRWSPYRDVPDSKKAFLSLLAQVHNWQRECGEGRTIVHCLWVHFTSFMANTGTVGAFLNWHCSLCSHSCETQHFLCDLYKYYKFNSCSFFFLCLNGKTLKTLNWRLDLDIDYALRCQTSCILLTSLLLFKTCHSHKKISFRVKYKYVCITKGKINHCVITSAVWFEVPAPVSMSGPFDLWRSGCVLDISHLIRSPLPYFNENFTQIFILKVCQLAFFWQRAWSVLSQTVTFHSVAPPPRRCLSCSATSLLGHSCLSASGLCVSVSVFILSGAGMVAVGAVPSVPAPWSWKWFVTTAWWTYSLLPKRCATLSQTWWRQWWACRSSYLHLLQHIISYCASAADWECNGSGDFYRKSAALPKYNHITPHLFIH